MLCKKCGIEGRIASTRTEVAGDQSPDTTTKVYSVMEVTCINPQCECFGKVIEEKRVLIYDGT